MAKNEEPYQAVCSILSSLPTSQARESQVTRPSPAITYDSFYVADGYDGLCGRITYVR